MKIRFLFCLCTLLLCLSSASAYTKEPLRVGVISSGPLASLEPLPLRVALQEGYCRDEGLELQLVEFSSWKDRDQALRDGSIDGAVIGYVEGLRLISEGIDLKFTTSCKTMHWLVTGRDVRNEAGVPVKYIEDIAGKKIAVIPDSTIDHSWMRKTEGVDFKGKPPVRVEMDESRYSLQRLDDGSVDAILLPDVSAMNAGADGYHLGMTVDNHISGIAFTARAIEAKDKEILAMARAYSKGAARVRKVELLSELDGVKDMAKSPEEMLLSKYPGFISSFPLTYAIEWMKVRGLLPESFQYGDAIEEKYYMILLEKN